jgi:hypothetical protein
LETDGEPGCGETTANVFDGGEVGSEKFTGDGDELSECKRSASVSNGFSSSKGSMV